MTKKVYDPEFKKTIVSLYQSGKTVNELCSEFSISISSINRWRKEFETSKESKTHHKIEATQRIKVLEKELKEIKYNEKKLK